MRKIGLLCWFLPFLSWSHEFLVWDFCKKEQCFWVEHDVNMALQASFTKDCQNLMESSREQLQIHGQRIFHFNTKALYQWTAKQKIQALNLKIEDEEHCLPIHCHPTEENCHFDGAYVVYFSAFKN